MTSETAGPEGRIGSRQFGRLVRYWWLFALGALVAGAVTTAAAQGYDILELEFAWTAEGADAALAGADLDAVRATILWDFLFLVLYASALYLGSLWASSEFESDRLRRVGQYIAMGALLAGLFDAIENVAMLAHINGLFGWSVWPLIAGIMASMKFPLVVLAVVYVMAGIGRWMVARIRSRHA